MRSILAERRARHSSLTSVYEGAMPDLTLPSFGFGSPWLLLLLLALPLWWMARRKRPPSAIVFSRAGTLAESPRKGQWVPRLLFLARNLAIVGLVIALARPRSGGRTEESLSAGIDIVVAFDLSSPTLPEYFQPENR